MRIGIVGAGNIARAHVNAIHLLPHTELVGVHDIAPDRAAAAATRFGCSAFDRLDSLYDQIDGVIIASPNHTHAELATEAIARGKHVLCEKPMTVTVGQARELTDMAEASGLSCGISFNYRYLDVVHEVRRIVDDGVLGRPLFIEVSFQRSSALTRRHFTWRDSEVGLSTSGALGDLGVHLLDLLPFMFGSAVEARNCRIKLRTNVPEREGRPVRVDDYAFVGGHLTNGVYFTMVASKSALPEDVGLSLRIVGEGSEFSYHSRDGAAYHLRSAVRWERRPLRQRRPLADPVGEVTGWGSTFHHQLREWSDLVHGRRPRTRLADFADGLRAQTILADLLEQGQYALV
ncbi:glucose-6-phosphate 3-dehydrogenase [Micromonospora phaseoli]|uniref:Glucose-6-phosphate 3-dehydrogenase n=1 Tax=Micromonospora phaseoli TaxID=1144548 RepID=A0A1H7DRD2_9ACTN|nr:Gfo/Idh/MocA family oxidoreductase [Micromonospora phaseoli]PZV89959.1 glucose-6-phosphate 3-dehydrogenase [Micromonospora phaseoli]GIJ78827.1 glucose-6-phosphate 3-dehydrogenase [Micromonospora phaseoli]SEK04313.1 glucose-6-phosphate 3-dehydrogenase [Micromonospora phaseoli]